MANDTVNTMDRDELFTLMRKAVRAELEGMTGGADIKKIASLTLAERKAYWKSVREEGRRQAC